MIQLVQRARRGLGAVIAALLVGLFANIVTAAPAAAQSREGASFITGTWQVTGSYSDTSSVSVNVTITFRADGTMRDEDGYNGRWIISGTSFLMYYPEEGARVGYVGVINGSEISGRFEAPSVAGTFRMRRAGGGGGGGSSTASLVGSWRLEGGSWGTGDFDFLSNGRFNSPGTAGGSWSQSNSSIYFRFDEYPNSTFSGTLTSSSVGTGNVTWANGADSFRMTRVGGGGGGGGGGGRLTEADVLGEWRVIGGTGCADWQRFIQTSRGMSWEYSVDGRNSWIENEASNGRYTLSNDALNINGRRILERRSNGEFWVVSQGPGGNYNCHVSR